MIDYGTEDNADSQRTTGEYQRQPTPAFLVFPTQIDQKPSYKDKAENNQAEYQDA